MKALALAFSLLPTEEKKSLIYIHRLDEKVHYYNLREELGVQETDLWDFLNRHPWAELQTKLAKLKNGKVAEYTELRFPFPAPEHMLCAGLNYADHVKESGQKPELVLFPKFGKITGFGARVPRQSEALLPELLDYEIELGMSFDRDIRSEDDLQKARAALFVANDFSDRTVQILYFGRDEKNPSYSFSAAKSKVGYSVVSPVVVVPEDWRAYAQNLRMRLSRNGKVAQSSSSSAMTETPEAMLRKALQSSPEQKWPVLKNEQSLALGEEKTLLPLDRNGRLYFPRHSIFMTGTPGGTIFQKPSLGSLAATLFQAPFVSNPLPDQGFKQRLRVALIRRLAKSGKYLAPGDRIESEIENLGRLNFSIEP